MINQGARGDRTPAGLPAQDAGDDADVGGRTSSVYPASLFGNTSAEMSTESLIPDEPRDGTEPDIALPSATPMRRGGDEARASQLRAARRQADRRHASVVAQWLRRLDAESGRSPR
jgi:hypothetical protein